MGEPAAFDRRMLEFLAGLDCQGNAARSRVGVNKVLAMKKPASGGLLRFACSYFLAVGILFVGFFPPASAGQSPSTATPGQMTPATAQGATPSPAPSAPPTPAAPRQLGKLKLGKPVERELKGGEIDVYTLKLKKGQFLHVVIEPNGIPLSVSLFEPDGKELVEASSLDEGWGPVPISIIAGVPASYGARVEPNEKGAPLGKYRITLADLREPRALDQTRIDAEQSLQDGVQLFGKQDGASVRAAIGVWEKSLPLWRRVEDRYEEAITLRAMGTSYRLITDPAKAIDYFSKSLAIFRELGDRREESPVLMNLGIVSANLGKKQEALDFYAQAQSILEHLGDRRSLGTVHNNIGNIYTDWSQYQRASNEYLQGLELSRASGDLGTQTSTLVNLGRLNRLMGEMRKALGYYAEALTLARAAGDRRQEGIILNNTGVVYKELGEVFKALDYYKQALPIRRELNDRKGEIATLNSIGVAYSYLGETEEGVRYYLEALTIARETGLHPDEANALHNIATDYERMGESKKALDYYNQALSLRHELGDRANEASTLGSIASTLRQLGDLPKALQYAQQELSIANEIGNRPEQAAALNNAATILRELGDERKALDYYNQALRIAQATENRSGESATLGSMGVSYATLGNYDKAIDYFNQSLSIDRAIADRRHETITLFNLAKTESRVGKKQEALKNYTDALSLARMTKNPWLEGSILAGLMSYWHEEKKPIVAIFLGKQSVDAYQQIRANNRDLEKSLQKSFLESKGDVYRQLAELLIGEGRLAEAEQVLDLLKNEEYFEFIRRSGADASSLTGDVGLTPAEKKEEARYRQLGEQIAAVGNERGELLAKKSRTPEEESRLAELTNAVEAANRDFQIFLDALNAELGGSEQAGERLNEVEEKVGSLQNALRGLPAGTVGLYTFVGDEKYHVIVVTREVNVERHYDIKREELRDKVEQFREALRSPRANPVPLAQEMYKILLGPVEKDLMAARARMVMLSLDDVLRYVPFAALHDGHQYVVEKYRTEVFTTASLANLKDKPQIASWSGLGMGVSKPLGGMPALPTVPEELHQIIHDQQDPADSGVLPGRVMLDEAFTEDGMKSELKKNYPLVHIASHFVSAPGNDRDSYLLLGEGDGKHLTLAEIHDSPEITFNDTELLTLSACNTAAGGKSNGREIDGLGMMAQRKGAKAVVASLWDVYDNSTGQLMADFYDRWIHTPGMTKGDALRLAQLDLLRGTAASDSGTSRGKLRPFPKTTARNSSASANATTSGARPMYSHPFYWAPFILIGNWQ